MTQTRLLIHVDDNDQPIGHITPDQRQPHHLYRVSALWLTNSAGHILIAQRHPHMTVAGGLWGPAVAGTVEEGESYLDNIRKETAEELGLTDVKFELGPKVLVDRRPHSRSYFCQWYTAVTDRAADQFELEAEEVSAVRWMSPADLRQEITEHPERFIPSAGRWIGRFI